MPKRSKVTEMEFLDWQGVCPGEPDPAAPRILVVGDLHQNVEHGDYWFSQEYDHFVQLGDVFDARDDETEDTIAMAEWLKKRLSDPRATFLLGNHEVHYLHSSEMTIFPGFTPDKAQAINDILGPEDWRNMRLACMAGNYLCSHAGFSSIWITPPTLENILARCKLAEDRAAQGELDPVLGYGELPRRLQQFGGPLAMPWEGFVPIEGISQIFGHSRGEDVRIKCGPSSTNLCIDVENGTVAALVQGSHVKILRLPSTSPKVIQAR